MKNTNSNSEPNQFKLLVQVRTPNLTESNCPENMGKHQSASYGKLTIT